MGTASEASPTLSGHLTMSVLVIVLRCCSIYLNYDASPHLQTKRYIATVTLDLRSLVVVTMSYAQEMNHLMVTISAVQLQIILAIKSLLTKTARTC
jgi:hypothetical protein